MEKSKGVFIAGATLLIISLSPILRSIIVTAMALYRAESFAWKLLSQYTAISFKPFILKMSYNGLNGLLDQISHALPLRHALSFNYFALVIMYLPYACHVALFVSAIGLFLRREICRRGAVISLLALLYLNVINTLGVVFYLPNIYFEHILTPLFFISIIYYLTRPKVKEQFK